MNTKLFLLGMTSAVLVVCAPAMAATNAPPASASKPTAVSRETQKSRSLPFRGKLVAVDGAAGTFTVGQRTFHVTRDTKIQKAGQVTKLERAAVGELVTGSYKRSEDGRLLAASLYLGGKSAPTEPGPEAKAGTSKAQEK